MELIRELGCHPARNGSGRSYPWGIFKCPFCQEEVVKERRHGYRDLSCGCSRYVLSGKSNSTRIILNGKVHPLYAIGNSMVLRCYNLSQKSYPNYGGRGITVCDEWREDINAFVKWGILNGYRRGLQIDRKKNGEGYSPENCWFTTNIINCRNRRSTKLNELIVKDIKDEYSALKCSQRSLCKKYDISPSHMSRLLRNKSW